jgi:hypothetical protein
MTIWGVLFRINNPWFLNPGLTLITMGKLHHLTTLKRNGRPRRSRQAGEEEETLWKALSPWHRRSHRFNGLVATMVSTMVSTIKYEDFL